MSATRAERLASSFAAAAPAYAVAELLSAAGLPARLAAVMVELHREGAADMLRIDPWRLLDVPDARPEQADALARSMEPGVSRADARRGRSLVAHLLARAARDGHTAMPMAVLESALAGLGVPAPPVAVDGAVADGRALTFTDVEAGEDPSAVVALARYGIAERVLAEGLARLAAGAEALEAVTPATAGLDAAQSAAVAAVAGAGVSVLTGGPGTGKSRTVAAVVTMADRHGLEVALAAPTGRAAKRLEELTGHPATTLHRLLGAQGAGGGFARGEDWPLDADLVVVDEASMVDVELGAALLAACADGTRLLLVGDPAQLPSIGPGRVLGDVLDAGTVPVTELTTLYRQAEGGTIARLAIAVRSGELPPVDDPEREVVVVPVRDGTDAARRVVQLVTDSIPRALGIPAADVQVVTPVHRGPAGTQALNSALKAVLNPGGGTLSGFDPGDRVVATANRPDVGFANGEVGTVSEVVDGGLAVVFAGAEVTVPTAVLGDLRHGWAITVHRAQGSEWPAVVVALPGDATGMLSRPLVYTAITRAQRHLSVVHGAGPALARAVRQVGARPRRTRLATLLRDG